MDGKVFFGNEIVDAETLWCRKVKDDSPLPIFLWSRICGGALGGVGRRGARMCPSSRGALGEGGQGCVPAPPLSVTQHQ